MIDRLCATLRYPLDWLPEVVVVAATAIVAWEAVKALWRMVWAGWC